MWPRIVIMGGLGNQLFQWAAAHEMLENRRQKFVPLFRFPEANEREFKLNYLRKHCSHMRRRRLSIFLSRLGEERISSNIRNKLIKLISKILFDISFQENAFYPYMKSKAKSKYKMRIWKGYFQHLSYFQNNLDTIYAEMSIALQNIKWPANFKLPPNCVSIHIRRGDYLAGEQGLLSVNYYKEIIEQYPNRPIIVFSDDELVGQNLANELNASYFFGSDSANEWQLLKIFANSAIAVIANSSLSWWGGLMCELNGGQVFVPTPWFRNRPDLVGPQIPNQQTVIAKWV